MNKALPLDSAYGSAEGCRRPLEFDSDFDGDVDAVDFAILQRCMTAPGSASGYPPNCPPIEQIDANGDGWIDVNDFPLFDRCSSGPKVAAPPCCGDPVTTDITATKINVATDGSFTRGTTAFLQNGEYPPNTRRTLAVPIVSQPAVDDGIRIGELGADGDALPWCSDASGLYAIASKAKSKLYRSTNGLTDWSLVMIFPTQINGLFTVTLPEGTGRLLAWIGVGGSVRPWYSDNGTDWAQCSSPNQRGAPFVSGVGQNGATIVSGQYYWVDGTTVKELWRSQDYGLTWTKVFTSSDGFTHFHAVGYHAGTGKWFADTGDGGPLLDYQRTYISEDDGLTWARLGIDRTSPCGRIVGYFDEGHPTRVYYGSDDWNRAAWFDLSDYTSGTFQKVQFEDTAHNFWCFFKHDGFYYASAETSSANGNHAVILVSLDKENWITYHRITDPTVRTASRFAGFVGGKLHFNINKDAVGNYLNAGHLVLTPARVSIQTGLLLIPEKTNLLAPEIARADTKTGWTTWGSPSFVVDGTTQFLPSSLTTAGCLRMSKTGMSQNGLIEAYTSNVTFPAGTYVGHAWLKGSAKYVRLYLNSATGQSDNYGLRDSSDWTEVWTRPLALGAPGPLRLHVNAYAEDVNRTATVWIGAAEVVAVPFSADWSPGGATQATDAFVLTQNLPKDWTLFASAIVPGSTAEIGWMTDYYLLSIVSAAASGDYAEFFWNASSRRWSMEVTNATIPGGIRITSTPRYLQRWALVRFAIRNSNGQLRLSVMDGVTTEHLGGVLTKDGAPLSGQCYLRYGRSDGSAGLPVILCDVCVYNTALSDAEVSAKMDSAL